MPFRTLQGKTAINVPAGKNLIGAFHQPVVVYADMNLLVSLGRRELVEGIAEAIKMGVIRIPSLFDLLEANPEQVMALQPDLIEQANIVVLCACTGCQDPRLLFPAPGDVRRNPWQG